ncbi:MAG: response regulator [Cyanobacteria bacterium RM1_2_2]|nr:response regulator [Cyanobacteria bacterium RM1_2_2]
MEQLQKYILILDEGSDDLQIIESLLGHLRCPIVVAASPEQAMARASQAPPYLLILVGNQQDWSKPLVHQLVHQFRGLANAYGTTIVALTDVHAPSWLRQEDNPGVDGFLVKPLNQDILSSLVHSAWVRQTYCSSH